MRKSLYEAIREGRFVEIAAGEFDALRENGVIVDDDVDEYAVLAGNYDRAVSAESEVYDLTLLPSLDCNLRCWYCFETHVVGSRMDASVREAVFRHVELVCRRDHIKYIRVELFGGEPLLYFREELYPLLRRIKDLAASRDKEASFFFVTNGVCITDEMIPLFAELNAGFQISIDGYREKHNAVKKIPGSDEDVYGRVIRSIHRLAESYGTYINLRINYDDQTLHHIEDVIRDIIDINPQRLGIHLERVWQTARDGGRRYDMSRVLAFIMANGFTVSYMNLHRKHVSCKASNANQAVISFNGDVYKCSGRDFSEKHREGRLEADGRIEWERAKLDRRMGIRTFDNALCRGCNLLPLCCGPCCQKQIDSPGEYERYCQKRLMEISLEDYLIYQFKNEILRRKIYESQHD
ncbi:MAG: radical SAM protein [Tannerellaceae bacterium]|nr:radical SAM protein [Tannerellaceae bacterium]